MFEIEEKDLLDLIHYARRYCDNWCSYAASDFNEIYDRIRSERPILFELYEKHDKVLTEYGKYFPHAKDSSSGPWPNKWKKDG